jgi:methyl-accepting chemotaxis protein
MPVTNVEYELKDGSSIVSKTDLKGIITYVNDDFLDASGYAEQELIGQPHNLVRHPDMPEEAFADLWRTLKKGRPWTGLVKNRRKDGGFYWVIANATPIWENGSCVGYMLVRSKPTRAQIEAHEAVYRLFKEGRQGKLRIVEGKAVKGSLLRRLDVFGELPIKVRLMALISILSLLLLAVGIAGLTGMRTTMDRADAAVAHDWEPRVNVCETVALMQRNRVLIMDAILNPTQENIKKRSDEFEKNRDEISKRINELNSGEQNDPELKALLEKFTVAREDLVKNGYIPAIGALNAGNIKEAVRITRDQISPLNEPVKAAQKELNAFYERDVKAVDEEAESIFASQIKVLSVAMAGGIILALGLGWVVVSGLVRSITTARNQLVRISQGQYHDVIEVKHADETGLLLYSMKSMQIRMGFEVSEARKIADESLRVKNALDSVGSNVTISDNENVLIYMNRAARKQFEMMEKTMQQRFPEFVTDRLIGRKLSEFFEDEKLKEAYRVRLDTDKTFNTEMGGRILRLHTSPVYNDAGRYLGRVTQWVDRTDEVAVEREIATIVAAASNGDFDQRIGIEGKQDFFLTLGQSMNQLMENSSSALNEVAHVLGALAKGDLTQTMSGDYMGTFGQLKEDSDATVQQLTETIRRIKEAGDTINTAAREIASGNTDLSQRTEEQASSLEETAASMEQLTSTVKQNAENAKQANQLALGASDIAMKGGEVVGKVVHTMSSISESSKKIVDIISVIDGIAFQTNILALNAAVEAARAGEQGRGFAVVASEVRNLAQRSAAAAKEIKELINDSVDKVEVGTELVDKAGKTMEEVVVSVKRVTDIMGEITAASSEQSQGIEQVNQAITQMDDVTQQNAALVEQAAAAAESMEEQAQQLSALMSSFRLSGETGRAVAVSAPRLPAQSGGGDGFSFEDAVAAHTKWKARLMDYINGKSQEKLDVTKVSRDDQCPLGQWIHGSATSYSSMREYGDLKKHHAAFHRSVGEIVQCVHDHEHDEATKKLGGDFFRQSTQTVKAIRALQNRVEGGAPAHHQPVVSQQRMAPRGGRAAPPPASDDGDWQEF